MTPFKPIRPGGNLSARAMNQLQDAAERSAQTVTDAASGLEVIRSASGPLFRISTLPYLLVRITGHVMAATGGTAPDSYYSGQQVYTTKGATGAADLTTGQAFTADQYPLIEANDNDAVPENAVVRAFPGEGGYYTFIFGGAADCVWTTPATGALCETSCEHTLTWDNCDSDTITHNVLLLSFPSEVRFCLSQSTGPAPISVVKRVARAVPTTVGQSVELGTVPMGSVIDIGINGGTGWQTSKLYNVSHAYDTSDPTHWYEVRPLSAPPVYGAGHDFALDVKRNGSLQTYRIRRVAGTTAATASADFYTSQPFTPSTATGATAAVGYAPNMVMTQTGDKVAVGKLSTDPPTYLLDIGSAGAGSAADGLAFNCDSSNVGTRLTRWRLSGTAKYGLEYNGITDLLLVTNGGSTVFSWWDRTAGHFNTTGTVIDTNGGVNPVLMSQLGTSSGFGTLDFQPTSVNSICEVEVLPSGTQDESRLVLFNSSTRTVAGFLRFSVNGATGAIDSLSVGGGSAPTRFEINVATALTQNIGFQGTNPISKPTVTGSRAGNAALAALLTALANYGLITDSTSA